MVQSEAGGYLCLLLKAKNIEKHPDRLYSLRLNVEIMLGFWTAGR